MPFINSFKRLSPKTWVSLGVTGLLFIAIFITQYASLSSRDNRSQAATTITVDTPTTAALDQIASTVSFSHTTGTGSDQLLLVGVTMRKSGSVYVSKINYGGASLSPVVVADQGGTRTEVWDLINPGAGTNTINVFFNGNVSASIAGAMVLSGVDTGRPINTVGSFASGFSTNPSVTLPSNPGEMVVDVLGLPNLSTDTITPGAEQSLLWNVWSGVNSQERGGSSWKQGAASVTMSWTTKNEANSLVAVSVRPVPTSTPAPTPSPSPSPSPSPKPSPRPAPRPAPINSDIIVSFGSIPYLKGKLSVTVSVAGTPLTKTVDVDASGGSTNLPNNSVLAANSPYNLLASAKFVLRQNVGFTYANSTQVAFAAFVPGDFNQDNQVDQSDVDAFISKGAPQQDALFDVNIDGAVNAVDYSILLTSLGKKGN